jgi:hypothetical protein
MEVFNQNSFPEKETLQKLLNGGLSDVEINIIVAAVKLHQPKDEFGAGIKRYLEDHGYDARHLMNWHKIAQKRVNQNVRQKGKFPLTGFVKVAAAITLGLGMYSIFNYKNDSLPSWQSYYTKDAGFPVFMEGRSDLQWMEYYRASDHTESIKLIEQQLKTNPQNDTLLYYKIVCMFELGMPLNKTSLQLPKDSLFNQKSRLILAYSFWRNGMVNEALNEFKNLSFSNIEFISKNGRLGIKALKGSE